MMRFAAAALVLALGACAHAPEVAVLTSSGPPSAGARFAMVGEGPADRAVAAALAARGLRAAAPGETPDVFVQAALAETPRAVEALVPDADAPDPEWLAKGPAARPWVFSRGAHVLTVAILDSQGRILFRSRASRAFRTPEPSVALPALADAAVAGLGRQADAPPAG